MCRAQAWNDKKENSMSLTTKFNLVLIVVFSLGLAVAGVLSNKILQDNARHEVIERAGLMMEAALAVRSYTVNEIRPLLVSQMETEFLPQSVPAYAATQSFQELRKNHPAYSYKEATLNPTNPQDRPVEWEADIIEQFRNHNDQGEIIGERSTPIGDSLYLARPIKIKNGACLTCHSTVEAAPKTLLARYGNANGFGWKLNDIVGAQIVSVPMSLPFEKARKAFNTFMASLVAIFVALIVILNVMLRTVVIAPVTRMSQIADEVSKGNMEADELPETGKDEMSVLAASFNRMRRSLEKAMKMLE
jgi:HAMP domain-containing protein